MRPLARVTVDGKPVSDALWPRLVSLSVTDKEGAAADTVEIELADGDPLLEIPRRGAKLKVWLGYEETGLRDMGEFAVDEIEVSCKPYGLRISGKSAAMKGVLKSARERHWDKANLGDIVSQIAREAGLTPAISPSLAGRMIKYIAQQDESAMHFLERLARRHGALFAVKDGRLLFVEKSQGASASGKALPPVVIRPEMILTGTCRMSITDRERYKTVTAVIEDRGRQKRVEVQVDCDPEGDGTFRLREPFASSEEARAGAEAKARELMAGVVTAQVTVEGDPAILAGAPLVYEGVRPGIDGLPWIVETARHQYSKEGYVTSVDARRKPEGGEGASGADEQN